MDVAAVGADLTPAQQDETLSDLAFFLGEFGSTRAVRVTLQDQQSDIKRFEAQVRQLLGDWSSKAAEKDTKPSKITRKSSGNATADETMADLAFFLTTYGSTRAVREKLTSQRKEIVALQRTIKWLHERQSTADQSEGSSHVEYVGTKSAPGATMEKGDNKQDGDTNSMNGTNHDDDNESNGNADIVDVNVAGRVGDDVEMASPEEEKEPLAQATGPRDSSGEDKGMRKVNAGPKESEVVVALLNCETERYADEASDGRRRRASSAGKQTERADVVVPDVLAVESSAALCAAESIDTDGDATEQGGSQQINGVANQRQPAVETLSAVSTSRGKKNRCTFPGCEKWSQAHRLCYAHGGYRTCKVDSCSRKATTGGLCGKHGGGTRCSSNDCEKMCVSGGYGHCYKHARAQGLMKKAECSTDGCEKSSFPSGHGHCFKHACAQGFEMKAKCKADGCYRQRVNQRFCLKHSTQPPNSQLAEQLNSQSSKRVIKRRGSHVTCKATGCLKWVKRHGDTNEYCDSHRDGNLSSEGNSMATANQDETTGLGLCKESGCTNTGLYGAEKTGYCFRHGGGYRCKVEGCPKARQRHGLCSSHGGKSDCKVDGCEKRAAVRGCCRRHYRDNLASEMATLQ